MIDISLSAVTRKATLAALQVINTHLDNAADKAPGPCSDKLATRLHTDIETAVRELFDTDQAPHGMRLIS